MAFVNELVPDADKTRHVFSGIKYPAYGDSIRPYKWTIDRERDVFLFPTRFGGPDSHNEAFFVMGCQDQLIRLILNWKVEGTFQDGYTYTWRIREMAIPQGLHKDRQAILQDLKEALDTYGDTFQRKNILNVQFEF